MECRMSLVPFRLVLGTVLVHLVRGAANCPVPSSNSEGTAIPGVQTEVAQKLSLFKCLLAFLTSLI